MVDSPHFLYTFYLFKAHETCTVSFNYFAYYDENLFNENPRYRKQYIRCMGINVRYALISIIYSGKQFHATQNIRTKFDEVISYIGRFIRYNTYLKGGSGHTSYIRVRGSCDLVSSFFGTASLRGTSLPHFA